MNRLMAGLLGLSLGIVSLVGPAPTSAQESTPSTVTDLSAYDPPRGNGRDGVEVARGDDGDTISYTIVENPETDGDATTAVYPEAPTPPDLSRVPVMDSGETTVAPPSGEPASAPVDGSQPGGVVGDATTADPAGEGAPVVAMCSDFATWYDSQIYYESVGATAAAPELVSSLDPDVDGVACEEIMQFS